MGRRPVQHADIVISWLTLDIEQASWPESSETGTRWPGRTAQLGADDFDFLLRRWWQHLAAMVVNLMPWAHPDQRQKKDLKKRLNQTCMGKM